VLKKIKTTTTPALFLYCHRENFLHLFRGKETEKRVGTKAFHWSKPSRKKRWEKTKPY